MEKLHNSEIGATHFVPKEGQRALLCSNIAPSRCPSFGDEAVKNFVEYSHVLKRIHIRLINEGYIIKDGKIYKPNTV